MDKQIHKLEKLVRKNLYKSKSHIRMNFGIASKSSDNEMWCYNHYRWGIWREQIIFIFDENDVVIDIMIAEYILWKEIRNIFYYEGQTPEYKVMNFFNENMQKTDII